MSFNNSIYCRASPPLIYAGRHDLKPRSLINEPLIIFADEPTGNLDTKSEAEIIAILKDLNAKGKTIVMVTHEREVAEHAKRIIMMRDGKIISDERKAPLPPKIDVDLKPIEQALADFDNAKGRAHLMDHIRQSIDAIVAHKLRSLLSMLGILIGVAAVIAMLALGEGAKAGGTDYETMRASTPVEGRFFTDQELKSRERVALVGNTVITQIFGDTDPVGKSIKINRVNFTVIGVLPTKGASGFSDADDVILVPVTERTREIGLRKSLGARKADITSQFLIESVLMTFTGGILGVILGVSVAMLLSLVLGWATKVSLVSIIGSTAFSAMVGVMFGLRPAMQAANLNPIEALRYG